MQIIQSIISSGANAIGTPLTPIHLRLSETLAGKVKNNQIYDTDTIVTPEDIGLTSEQLANLPDDSYIATLTIPEFINYEPQDCSLLSGQEKEECILTNRLHTEVIDSENGPIDIILTNTDTTNYLKLGKQYLKLFDPQYADIKDAVLASGISEEDIYNNDFLYVEVKITATTETGKINKLRIGLYRSLDKIIVNSDLQAPASSQTTTE